MQGTCTPAALRQSAGGRGRDRRRDDGHFDRAGAAGARPAGRRRRGRACRGRPDGPHDGEAHGPARSDLRRADRAARPGKGGDVRAGQPARRGALLRAHRAGAHRLRSGAHGLVALLLRPGGLPAARVRGGAGARAGRVVRAGHTPAAARMRRRAAARAGAVPSAEVPAGAGRPADDLRAHAGRARRGRHAVHPARNDRGRRAWYLRRTTRS